MNDQKIANPRDLAVTVASIKPDQDAHLKILRDGETKDVTVHVGQMQNDQTTSNMQESGDQHHEQIGLALAPLTPDMRNQLDVPDGMHGAVVRGVQPGSAAEMAGLQPGDVIVGVGTKSVNSPGDAAHAIRSAMHGERHALALRVIRNGQPLFVGINTDQKQG